MTDDVTEGHTADGAGGAGGKQKGRRPPPSDRELEAMVPRERGRRELRVGIFVIVGILSFLAVLFLLTDPATFRGRYMVVTTMESAGGIRRGDPIQLRGVNIGRINSFNLRRDGRVDITMEIEGEWPLREGSTATLGESGLFGGRTMEILPGASDEMVAAWDTIAGISEGATIFEAAEELGKQARDVLGRLGTTLDESTVSGIQGSVLELQALLRELRAVTGAQREELASLTASLNRSAAGLEAASEGGPDVRSAAARADSAFVRLNGTIATLDAASSSLDAILARMEEGEGTLGRLSRDEELYENMNQAAGNIASLAADIQANPGRYLRFGIF